MVDPRMRVEGGGLRELDSPVNVHGLQNMSVGYPEARVRLDDHPIHPTSTRNLDFVTNRLLFTFRYANASYN